MSAPERLLSPELKEYVMRRSGIESMDAPELDKTRQSIMAPEHHPLPDGLQLVDTSGLEVAQSEKLPITHPDDTYPKEVKHEERPKITSQRWRIYAAVIVLIVILAISLGVGLSVGLRESSSSPSATNIMSSPSAPISKNGALNDTSLAAITTADNSRRIFFQDVNGTLRHATLVPSTNTWVFVRDFLLTTAQPRNNTPLAVLSVNTSTSGAYITLFYIDTHNLLACILLNPDGLTDGTNIINGSFPTAPNTRSLSISQLSTSDYGLTVGSSIVTGESLLFYEDPNRAVSAIHGKILSTIPAGGVVIGPPYWIWSNVTELFSSKALNVGYPGEAPENFQLSAPFAASALSQRPASNFVLATFFNPQVLLNLTATTFRSVQIYNLTGPGGLPTDFGGNILGPQTTDSVSALRKSDWLMCYICTADKPDDCNDLEVFFVINQTLQAVSMEYSPPTPYPFSRLAFANSTTASSMYIYHQFNESMLIEDAYGNSADWTSTNITLPAI